MKETIKMIGLITLICFSFFYTDKVINVINEQDPIMIKINEVKDKYNIPSINATTTKDTIIPGINGQEVDVEKSYNNMREIGIFKSNLLIYKEISPEITLSENYDKYIISGNNKINNVSIVMTITSSNINKLSELNNQNLNLFIDNDTLTKNLSNIKKLQNTSIYPYGNNGTYEEDILTISNNLLDKNVNNKPLYCLATIKNSQTLKKCQNKKMHTIIPSINGENNAYNVIKNNIKNGSIIYLKTDSKTLEELNEIINYITSKGYHIVSLEKLLSENIK